VQTGNVGGGSATDGRSMGGDAGVSGAIEWKNGTCVMAGARKTKRIAFLQIYAASIPRGTFQSVASDSPRKLQKICQSELFTSSIVDGAGMA